MGNLLTEAAEVGVKNVGKRVARSSVKEGTKGVLKGAVRWASANPKTAAVLGIVGWSNLTDRPIIDIVGKQVLGKEKGEGLLHSVYDNVFGEGSADETVDGINASLAKISDATERMKDSFSGRQGQQGNFMAGNPNSAYMQQLCYAEDLTALQQEEYAQMLNGGSGPGQGYVSSGRGGLLNTGLSNFFGDLTGDGFSAKNISLLSLAAYMMFGRFGWLAKTAGVLLGHYGLNSVERGLPQNASVSREDFRSRVEDRARALEQEEDRAVSRSRNV